MIQGIYKIKFYKVEISVGENIKNFADKRKNSRLKISNFPFCQNVLLKNVLKLDLD